MAQHATDSMYDSGRVKADLQHFCDSIRDYAHANPAVTGVEKLSKRAQSDLVSVSKLHANVVNRQEQQALGDASTSHSADDFTRQRLQAEQLQGVRNNLRGMQAELAVAQQAPGVICLGTRFYASITAGDYLHNIWCPISHTSVVLGCTKL